LIQVKDRRRRVRYPRLLAYRENAMPTEIALVAGAIVLIFFTFACVLGWVERQTRQ
jgi:hypothetical protein